MSERKELRHCVAKRAATTHVTNKFAVMTIRNSRWKWAIITMVFLLAIAAAVIGSLRPSSNINLTNLNNVAELREQFNKDAGKVRVLLLLAPT